MGVIKENFLHHNIIGPHAAHAAINMQADGIFHHVGQLQHGGGITRRGTLGNQHRGSNALGFTHGHHCVGGVLAVVKRNRFLFLVLSVVGQGTSGVVGASVGVGSGPDHAAGAGGTVATAVERRLILIGHYSIGIKIDGGVRDLVVVDFRAHGDNHLPRAECRFQSRPHLGRQVLLVIATGGQPVVGHCKRAISLARRGKRVAIIISHHHVVGLQPLNAAGH